jgi:DNA invertase Pin-like site-specific DNA recombinase
MTVAAIYARVSSDKQREENTIASQTAAVIDRNCPFQTSCRAATTS